MSRTYRVAVVGATGVVGTTMLELLRDRRFPASEIVPFASERSAGRELDGGLVVRALNADADLGGFDVALFSAGGGTSREWAPRFVDAGAVVVDNSSAWRRDPDIPLVVSEVNPHALERHRGLIANPNCSTMQMLVALAPIHRRAGIERLVVSTYQSVSGTGKKAIDELDAQARASLDGGEMPEPEVYPEPIAFNVIGAAGNFAEGDDHTDEERKMMFETRKILEDESIGQRADPRADLARAGARLAQRRCRRGRRGRAHAPAIGRPGRGVRGPDPRRRVASTGVQHVDRERQLAQGCGDQRRPDRRGSGRAGAPRPPRFGRRVAGSPSPFRSAETQLSAI
jgi:Semialdehyde dehydrogenase, NAD binding domain/Semialdehyde dehydrogenase, dimerisation domain